MLKHWNQWFPNLRHPLRIQTLVGKQPDSLSFHGGITSITFVFYLRDLAFGTPSACSLHCIVFCGILQRITSSWLFSLPLHRENFNYVTSMNNGCAAVRKEFVLHLYNQRYFDCSRCRPQCRRNSGPLCCEAPFPGSPWVSFTPVHLSEQTLLSKKRWSPETIAFCGLSLYSLSRKMGSALWYCAMQAWRVALYHVTAYRPHFWVQSYTMPAIVFAFLNYGISQKGA